MRFSIRTLLALMTVAALIMVALRTRRDAFAALARSEQLAAEIDLMKQTRAAQPRNPITTQAQQDLHASLHENRIRCVQQLSNLIERYSVMEARDASTLSLRSIPTLRTDAGRAPIAIKLIVPEKRSIWLKFGVHPKTRESPQDGLENSENGLLADAPFEQSGPYEIQLPAGEPIVSFEVDDPRQGLLPIRIRLNDQTLARPINATGQPVDSSGSMSIAAVEQIDYGPKRSLPSLATFGVNVQEEPAPAPKATYGFSIWLSERSSSFDPFPGP